MKKPCVIIGATVLGLGGIRTHLMLLCELLRDNAVDVIVFCTGADWDDQSINQMRLIGVRFILPPQIIRWNKRLSALYSAFAWFFYMPRQANSVYCIGTGYSCLWLNLLKPPGVLSIDHEIVDVPQPGSVAFKCVDALDVSVANSKKVGDLMRKQWPEKPIQDIPFLTSRQATLPPARVPRVADAPLRVVYLGRMVSHKRPDKLVKRWPTLTESGKSDLAGATLDVYGFDPEGGMLAELKAFVDQHHLTAQIKIQGAYGLAELPGILAAADIVVLPSLDEGLPLVLVEAMMHGVPFVATAAGGTEELGENNPDVIVTTTVWEDFESGLQTMASKIRAGDIDPLRLHRWVEERYGYNVVAGKWVDCLLNPDHFFKL